MGLLNKRTIEKAKSMAYKNKDKIADTVNKATDKIDAKTGGKHADKLKKLDDAASKFAGRTPTSSTGDGESGDVDPDGTTDAG